MTAQSPRRPNPSRIWRNVASTCTGATLFLVCVALSFLFMAATSAAQTLTTLTSFTSSDGYAPIGSIARDSQGNSYGATQYGGAYGQGEVYQVASNGTLTVLHNFCPQPGCTDGGQPWGGLILASDGNLYGTTLGTVYKITPSGDLTTIYTFCSLSGCADGQTTYAPLVQGSDGNFYGTALLGGIATQPCGGTCGTVFKLTPSGVLTVLHSFRGKDGFYPAAGLVQGTDGNFYGTTTLGGTHNLGTAFKVTPAGTFTLLHSFLTTDGSYSTLFLQGSDGNFYGTSMFRGAQNHGTVFRMTPSGTLTVLRAFNSNVGVNPNTLLQGADGNLYGTTGLNGSSGGTVFRMTLSGQLKTVYGFCSVTNCADGIAPTSIIQSGGILYGATAEGGGNTCQVVGNTTSCGTVFSLTTNASRKP
jgi:uncharacterized repeat protein (TIGR03803 family)